jgi:peroxiredoxin
MSDDRPPMLRYGFEAPAFSLPSTSGRDISLAEFKGASDVVLLFYCYDWGNI